MTTILTRNNTFETNSSSCHTLTIDDTVPLKTTNTSQINIGLYAYEFGWSEDIYCDFDDKLAYLMLYIRDWKTVNHYESYVGTVYDDTVQALAFAIILQSAVSEILGDNAIIHICDDNITSIPFVEFMSTINDHKDNEGLYEGYIDHQSVEYDQLDYLFKDPINLQHFLFNINSYITTGNDND